MDKRLAWGCLRMFVALNDHRLDLADNETVNQTAGALCRRREEMGGVSVVVTGKSSAHHSLPVGADSIEPCVGNFVDKSMAAEFDDEPGDAFVSSVGLVAIGRGAAVEPAGEISVAEVVHGVLARPAQP
jgi:hypothetical protein